MLAALFQDELHELRDGNAGTRQLMHFGVLFGSKRVVVYVQPDPSLAISPNTARNQLLIDGEPLPWDHWAAEFRAKLPEPITRMMEKLPGQAGDEASSEDAIRQRLKRIEELMRFTKYRRSPDGSVQYRGRRDRRHTSRGRRPGHSGKKSQTGT